MELARGIPAHVSPDVVVDIDIYDILGGAEDPQITWRAFQGKEPLVYSSRNGGHWIAASDDAIFCWIRSVGP